MHDAWNACTHREPICCLGYKSLKIGTGAQKVVLLYGVFLVKGLRNFKTLPSEPPTNCSCVLDFLNQYVNVTGQR